MRAIGYLIIGTILGVTSALWIPVIEEFKIAFTIHYLTALGVLLYAIHKQTKE